jgi:hypothetical protein
MAGVNRDASLFCGVPGSGAVARHAAVVRSARFGSAVRPAAASLGAPAGRSLRRNKPGRGRNSCTPRPGCDSRRTRKIVPMQPRHGPRRTEQVDERHVCRDIDPACVLPSTVWGTAPRRNRQVQNRRRACPSIRANLAASPRPSHPGIFRQNNARRPTFSRPVPPQHDARSHIYAGSDSHQHNTAAGGHPVDIAWHNVLCAA